MDRIKEIEEKVKNHNEYKLTGFYDSRDLPEIFEDIEYLLAENKRLKEALDKIQNRAVTYKDTEPKVVVLSDIASIAGYATNVFIHGNSRTQK